MLIGTTMQYVVNKSIDLELSICGFAKKYGHIITYLRYTLSLLFSNGFLGDCDTFGNVDFVCCII